MLRLLKSLKTRALVRRLHEQARVDHYPRSYVKVCRTLLAAGQLSKAKRMAQEGLERFPHSEDLREILRHTWRQVKSHDIEQLRERCSNSPEVDDFHELAEVYLECEEYDEALAVAEELERRFPDETAGTLLQGDVLLQRFYKDKVASDARRGIVLLERVIEQDGEEFAPHYLLAQVYHYIGATSKALFHIYKALDIDADHEEARELYEGLSELPLEDVEEGALLREIEENEASACERGPAKPTSSSALVRDLDQLSLLNGVTRVAFVSPEHDFVAERGECRSGEGEALCTMARSFRKAASVSAKRMGIGGFQHAVLTSDERMLQFHAVGNTVVLIESNDPSREDVIRAECMNFVASCARTEELVHA